MLLVGDMKPGTMPIRLQARMKAPIVPTSEM